MKHLRQVFITIVLVFTLTGVAAADDGTMHPWQPITSTGSTPPAEPLTLDDVTSETALAFLREMIGLY